MISRAEPLSLLTNRLLITSNITQPSRKRFCHQYRHICIVPVNGSHSARFVGKWVEVQPPFWVLQPPGFNWPTVISQKYSADLLTGFTTNRAWVFTSTICMPTNVVILSYTRSHTWSRISVTHVIMLGHTRYHVWSHMWSHEWPHVITFGHIHDHVWSHMWSRVITCMITCDPMHDHVWSHAWSRVVTFMITCGHIHDHV